MHILSLIFFDYPDPKASEEPIPTCRESAAQPKSIYSPLDFA
jgi:hypothetical protein